MKKGLVSLLLLIACGGYLFIVSCKKKHVEPFSTCGTGRVCAQIDSNAYVADSFVIDGEYLGCYANLVHIPDSAASKKFLSEFSVFGKRGNSDSASHEELYLYLIASNISAGTYTTSNSQLTFEYRTGATAHEQVWQTNSNNPGTVVITDIDTINNTATGTFSFTAVQQHVATPGQKVVQDGNFNRVKLFKYSK